MRPRFRYAVIVPIAFAMVFPAFAADAPKTPVTLESADKLLAAGALPEAARAYEAFARDYPKDPQAPRVFANAVIMNMRLGYLDASGAAENLRHFENTFVPVNIDTWAEMSFTLIDGFLNRDDHHAAIALLYRTIAVRDQFAADARKKKTHDLQTLREIEVRARGRLARVYTEMGDHRGAEIEHAGIQKLMPELGIWPGKKPPRVMAKHAETIEFIAETLFHAAEQKRFEAERVPLPAYTGKGDRDSVLAYINGPGEKWYKYREFSVKEAHRLYAFVLGVELQKPEPPKPPPPPSAMIGLVGGDPNAPVVPWDEDPVSPYYADPPSPRWAIAAAEGVGNLWSSFARESRMMPIPKEPKPAGLIPNADPFYAELMRGYSHSFVADSPAYTQKQRAKSAYQYCMELSIEQRIVNEHTRACLIWLSKNYGAEYHEPDEIAPPGEFIALGLVPRPAPLPTRPK